MAVTAAIVAGLMYGIYSSAFWYGVWQPITSCMPIGLVVGMALGDPVTGVMLGGSLQAIYLGMIAPGGNVPSEPQLAAAVAIPIAMISNLDFDTALTLAVPVGILGAFLTVLRYLICDFFVEPAERAAENGDTRGVWVWGFLIPFVVKFLIGFVAVFVAVTMGIDVVSGFMDAIPAWLQHGLSVAGGLLPAMGFGLMLVIMNKPSYIPLFLIGYFMVQYGNLSVMACALFAICIALFVTFFRNAIKDEAGSDDFDDDFDDEEEVAEKPHVLSAGDVNGFIFRWLLYAEVPHSYQRMQGVAVATAMAPALKKLYPNPEDKDKLAAALKREMMYFNTQAIWGSSVMAIALAMEEEQALTGSMSEEEAISSINGVKVGFMGPLAGIGDSLDFATLIMLLFSIGIPWAIAGNPAGAAPVSIGFPIITMAEAFILGNLGYRLGGAAISKLFTSGLVDALIDTTTMIGMFMMGALSGSYVNVVLANESAQATLDSIIPGLLPLLAVFALYFVFTKVTQNMPTVTFGIIVVAILLALIGVL